MQHLEVSGAVVLYIGRTVSKGRPQILDRKCQSLDTDSKLGPPGNGEEFLSSQP
jgi:hypothetical protein